MWWYLAGAVFFIAAACLFVAGPDTENPAPETPGRRTLRKLRTWISARQPLGR